MNQVESQNCALRLVAQDVPELCPRERCAFWDGDCVIERFGADVRSPDLAAYLLEARERLEQVRELAEAEEAHRQFAHRLGRDV
jgi:hypothetical protein